MRYTLRDTRHHGTTQLPRKIIISRSGGAFSLASLGSPGEQQSRRPCDRRSLSPEEGSGEPFIGIHEARRQVTLTLGG